MKPRRFSRHRCPACWLDVTQTSNRCINLHFINGANGVERCAGSEQPFRIAQPYTVHHLETPALPRRRGRTTIPPAPPRPRRVTLSLLRDSA